MVCCIFYLNHCPYLGSKFNLINWFGEECFSPHFKCLIRFCRISIVEVRKMTVISETRSSCFNIRQTSNPSRSGITISNRITSGSLAIASSIPDVPSNAEIKTEPGKVSLMILPKQFRLLSMSSIARILIIMPVIEKNLYSIQITSDYLRGQG